MAKVNGLIRWVGLGILISGMIVTFFVRAALVEERLEAMDTRHNTAIQVVREAHDKDIGYIREDIATIMADQKKILEKL